MKFRRAQHTFNIERITEFYTQILGLEILGNFKDHDGYNGVFLGFADESWELEFTENDTLPNRLSDPEDLLAFYPPTPADFEKIYHRILEHNFEILVPVNPYWIENGICIKDPDGFSIILVRKK